MKGNMYVRGSEKMYKVVQVTKNLLLVYLIRAWKLFIELAIS